MHNIMEKHQLTHLHLYIDCSTKYVSLEMTTIQNFLSSSFFIRFTLIFTLLFQMIDSSY